MQSLILNSLIKRSQILFDFLAIGTEPNFETKKNYYNKLQSPIYVKEMKSITGEAKIHISNEQETYFINIKDNVTLNETLLSKLSKSYKDLSNEMTSLAYRMKSISGIWKQLYRASEEYADNQSTINTYIIMSKLMNDWSQMLTTQASIISNDIRDYFKFHRKEFKSFKPVIAKVQLTQNNYFNENERVYQKKEYLFKKKDIAKWDLDPNNLENKLGLLNNKALAFSKMLPKETSHLNELKEIYGYFINSIIDEFQHMREINSKRHKEKVKQFAKQYSEIVSNIHISIADVISY